MRLLHLLLLATALLLSRLALAQTGPPVVPPDESLTESPGVESLNQQDSTLIQSPETVTAASPSRVRGGLFRRRRRDSAYVDTLGVGFFNKILAPVYPNPERAAALSFVLPGSGQLYNKRFAWIKVPIIYGLYGALIYNGETNRRAKNDFAVAYLRSLQDSTHQFSGTRFDDPQRLLTRRDNLDKNFQLAYIGVGILHLIQTLEAYTTAHLLEFDMDESLTVAPVIVAPPPGTSPEAGGARLAIGASWRFGDRRRTRPTR